LNYLVFSGHAVRPDTDLSMYDVGICTSFSVGLENYSKPPISQIKRVVRFDFMDSGLVFTPREEKPASTPVAVVFCDTHFVRNNDFRIAEFLEALFLSCNLKINLITAKRCSSFTRKRIRDLTFSTNHALVHYDTPSFTEQATIFSISDFLILPSTRSDFGLIPVRGLSCNLPIVCHDVIPLSPLISQARNGVKVACSKHVNWLGCETAVFDVNNMVAEVKRLLQANLIDFFLGQQLRWPIPATGHIFGMWASLLNL